MVISDVITKHYIYFRSFINQTDIADNYGRTSEDILQDMLYRALKHFKNKQITEEEGIEYIRKSLAAELHFQFKRNNNLVIFTDNLPEIDNDYARFGER